MEIYSHGCRKRRDAGPGASVPRLRSRVCQPIRHSLQLGDGASEPARRNEHIISGKPSLHIKRPYIEPSPYIEGSKARLPGLTAESRIIDAVFIIDLFPIETCFHRSQS